MKEEMIMNEGETLKKEEQVVEETAVEETTPAEGEPSEEEGKKKKPRVTFETRMTQFRTALTIAKQEPEFRAYLEKYGYNEARIDEGLALVDKTASQNETRNNNKAQQHAATLKVHQLKEKANVTLKRITTVGRLLFENDREIFEKLGLIGERRRDFAGWLEQNKSFLTNILASPEIIAEFAKYNVTQEELQAGNQELADVEEAYVRKQSIKAEAEKATEDKNNTYKELKTWMKDFYRIVEIALKNAPQLKEKVGIVVPYFR